MEVELFATPAQIPVLECNATLIGFFAGRRWGKTDTWFNRCTQRTFSAPRRFMYCAPSYALCKEQCDRCVNLWPREFVKRSTMQPFPLIELRNGSVIHFRSLDRPRLLRGGQFDEIDVDEIQDIPEETFDQVLMPMISDRRGTIMVMGQFRGQHCWYYQRIYLPGQNQEQHFIRSFVFPTSTGLQFQNAKGREMLAFMKTSIPRAVYEQEYECLATENIAAVFRYADLQIIKRGEASADPRGGRHYIIGYDLGEHHDPSALVVLEYETGTIVHAETIPLRIKHEVQAKKLAETARRYGGASVVIDGTGNGTGGQRKGPDETIRYYRDLIPDVRVVYWTEAFKAELVRTASLAIENAVLKKLAGGIMPLNVPAEHKLLHDQLAAYEFRREGERYIYGAPVKSGLHDDVASAFFMTLHAARQGWVRTNKTVDVSALY